jgi:hypothetical protein
MINKWQPHGVDTVTAYMLYFRCDAVACRTSFVNHLSLILHEPLAWAVSEFEYS